MRTELGGEQEHWVVGFRMCRRLDGGVWHWEVQGESYFGFCFYYKTFPLVFQALSSLRAILCDHTLLW